MFTKYCKLFLLFLALASCGNNFKVEADKIKAENDKLNKQLSGMAEEDKLIRGEYSEAIDALNTIDDTLNNITEREAEIKSLKKQSEVTKSTSQREKLLAKVENLTDANKNARNQVSQLQAALQKYRGENESLRKMIDHAEERVKTIDGDLKTKRNAIGDMQGTLKKTEDDLVVAQSDLSSAYEDLKVKTEKLQVTNDRLQKTIEELKTKEAFIGKEAWGYVCCGSKKFLRQKDILSNTTMKLTKGFQASAQANGSRINYYENNEIDCGGEGKITTILPERDPASYQITGSKIVIKNTESFWKTDKIVVLVKD